MLTWTLILIWNALLATSLLLLNLFLKKSEIEYILYELKPLYVNIVENNETSLNYIRICDAM